MKIEPYIVQLLYRYQCVTVPGLGAFLTETQSAQWHGAAQTFFPPKKVISFNAYLKNNDGLLANHIAQTEKIPYEVAVNGIEHAVHEWKMRLQDVGTIALRNIGELRYTSDKNVVFTPQEQVNYLTEAFGLSPVISPAVQREVLVHLDAVAPETAVEEIPVIPLGTEKTSAPWLKYAAIFVFGAGLLGSGGYFGNQYYEKQVQEATLAVQQKVQSQVQQKIANATFLLDNPIETLPAVSLTVQQEKLPYHVVAGAFRLEANADRVLYELKKLGFPARKIGPNKHGLYPVLYGSYARYSDARNQMETAQKSHNPEAWVLIEEL